MKQFGMKIAISEIQKKLVEILDVFIEACNRYDLRYYAIHGSLLGAVRHGGFISWDDDIDIAMPRADYDFLLDNAERIFSTQYFLQHFENERSTFYGGYSKLRDKYTTAMRMIDFGHSSCQGLGIDIFPLDNINRDDKNLQDNMTRLRRYQLQFYAKVYGNDGIRHFGRVKPEIWQEAVEKKDDYTFEELSCGIRDCCNYYNLTDTPMWAIFVQNGKDPLCFEKADFNGTENILFAGRTIKVPIGYDRILRTLYGRNYMVPPEVPKPKSEWSLFYDLHTSYQAYQDYFREIQAVEGKVIVLFGEGELQQRCAEKYADAKEICLVKNKEEIIGFRKEADEIIICSEVFTVRAEELRELGIEDYRIYVPHRKWLFERKRRSMRSVNEEIL